MCIGLHTLPPCLLFCGNYILHESEYDVHIFCVALDIIIYPVPVFTPFPGKGDRDNKSEVYFKNRLLLIVVNLTTTSFLVYFLTDFALSDLLSPAFTAGDFFALGVHYGR